ncbi:Mitochondrial import inner membrane translocase subunit tim23 [Podochytrium sp. JEL0797]|nr:Mitochondrial import inner membrane translocase subunit tim23 [Podochytrium sp. JEL0797]
MFGFGKQTEQPTPAKIESEFVSDSESTRAQTTSPAMSVSSLTLPGAYLHPITAQSPIEYLFINENPMGAPQGKPKERLTGSFGPLPMRTNYDKLLYGTGAAYFSGFIGGGAYGAIRGLQMAQGSSFKIRFNSVLNSIGRQGPRIANSMGVLTLGWALLDNTLYSWRGEVSDYYNHVGAAFLSGALFKSTAGVRPALIAGGLMSAVVGSYGLWEMSTSEKTKKPVSLPVPAPATA